MPREAFGLHVGEIEPQAHVRAAAEGNEGELVPVAPNLRAKAHRVVALRFGPKLRHVVSKQRIDAYAGAGRNAEAMNSKSRRACLGTDGTRGASRIASLKAISVSK